MSVAEMIINKKEKKKGNIDTLNMGDTFIEARHVQWGWNVK